ncbi:histone-like nucleoid-structuring protein Lsr2 [Nocardioides sp. AX2bis]|uniref:histone-like nucleoid-structuring protein Lsr2 n=1 Tax=Nocardioides sp. AX2bis TaxID=2653157 RepID=UPI0012F09C8A|nr:Lsr2 family protein [Nocardioides sp. AX2bis]VXC22194.1 Nucleoid-associated protein Lsr2 [Nocardioides sp. AX2bis]
MAQKVHIVLEDDLDGGDASETVSFGLDGTSYEIDLNEENAAGLREALSAYVGHARKVGSGRRTTKRSASSTGSTAGGPAAKDVREWAREAGHEVPDRGRIPADVREAYDAAH